MTMLGLIVANTTHRLLRSILCAGSLAVMSCTFVVAFTLLNQTTIPRDDFPGPHVIVVADGNWELPLSHVAALKSMPGVTEVEYEQQYMGVATIGGEKIAHSLWGASDGFMGSYPRRVVRISPELEAAWKADRQGIVAGKKLAAQLGWRPGSIVVVSNEVGAKLSGRYLGAFEGNYDGVVVHYDHAKASFAPNTPADMTRLVVGCEPARCKQLPDEIDERFTSGAATFSMSQEHFHEALAQSSSTISDLCALVGFAVIALAALITGCTLSISLRARVPEIATLRALGFTRTRSSLVLLGESTIIATAGGIVGALIPYVITAIHPITIGNDFMLAHMVVPVRLVWSGIALAVGVGIVVALWPVIRTLRASIVEGLA